MLLLAGYRAQAMKKESSLNQSVKASLLKTAAQSRPPDRIEVNGLHRISAKLHRRTSLLCSSSIREGGLRFLGQPSLAGSESESEIDRRRFAFLVFGPS